MNKLKIDKATAELLASARQTYGNKNQIMVCMEELCELACVLAKYPRYEDENKATSELYEKVLDEVADVTVILKHVTEIFDISDEALDDRINKKLERLKRWLLHSESMQETIDDRTIREYSHDWACTICGRSLKAMTEQEFNDTCGPCHRAQATEGKAPFCVPINTTALE